MRPDLTIVLLGGPGVGKSAAGNTILGRTAFRSESWFGPVTTERSAETGPVLGKRIKVIDTPEILGHEDQIRTCCQEVLQSPEPCLFLVVLGTARFTEVEQKKAVDAAVRVLGDDGVRSSYLLFTGGDQLDSTLENWIHQSDRSPLRDAVKRFGYRIHLFDNKTKDEDQVQRLLDKTEELWYQLGPQAQGVTVVLLGNSGSGKSASGNKILGRAAFESRPSLKPVTTMIREETGRVLGKRISVVDTPGILGSQEQIHTWCQTKLESSTLCLFLVVVRVGRFTEEDQKAVEAAIRVLGPRRFGNSYLLFTGGDSLKNSSLEIFTSEYEDSSLLGVVRRFGDRIHLFNNEDPGQKEVRELLQKSVPGLLDSIRMVDRRMVLLGLSGGGKSSSGNTILGSDEFLSGCGLDPVNAEPVCKSAAVEGRWVTVVDSPGFNSRDTDLHLVKEKFGKMMHLSDPGPHVFVLVVRIGRMSREDFILLRSLMEGLGRAAPNHNMVLFTYGDELRGRSIDELTQSSSCVSELVSMCGGRFCVFDNSPTGNRPQVRKFLDKVDEMVEANGGRYWGEFRTDDDDDNDDGLGLKHWMFRQRLKESTLFFCHRFFRTAQSLDDVYKKLNG